MARLSTGPLIAEVRGKSGDQIFSRNKSGAYVKAFAIPTNPNSERQQSIRTTYTMGVSDWQNLTEAERTLWNEFARSYHARRALSKSGILSGFNMFMRNRVMAYFYGVGGLTTPQPLVKLEPISFGSVFSSTTLGLQIEVNQPVDPNFRKMLIMGWSGPLSPGLRNVPIGRMPIVQTSFPDTDPQNYDQTANWELKFGDISTHIGKAIFIRIQHVDTYNGFETPAQFYKTIITNP